MSADAIRPSTPLEEKIVRAQVGETGLAHVLDTFESSRVLVLSRSDLPADDLRLLDPLVFDVNGVRMLAVFSHPNRTAAFVEEAPFALELWGAELVDIAPPGSGFVVNPRQEVGFEIVPSLLDIMRARHGRAERPS